MLLRGRPKQQLVTELAELIALSPQSAQLPEQDALRAFPLVEQAIQKMELWLGNAFRQLTYLISGKRCHGWVSLAAAGPARPKAGAMVKVSQPLRLPHSWRPASPIARRACE